MINVQLMPWQYDYLRHRAKYTCLMAGRRTGKTHVLKIALVEKALSIPGSKSLYLTPNGALAHEVFQEISRDKFLMKRILKIEMQPTRKIIWRNGSETYFRIYDRDNRQLGFGFDFVIFDEIQILASQAGRDSFFRVIRPLVMDRGGEITIAGQWKSKLCWYYKLWHEMKDNPNYKVYSIPSWEGYTFRDGKENHEEIVSAKETMLPNIFAQEIACEPTSSSDAIFTYEDVIACIKGSRKGPVSGHNYVIGADLGRTKDPSGWVVVDLGTREVVHSEVRSLGERHEHGAKELSKLAERYNNARVIIDATGGAVGGRRAKDAYVKFYRRFIKGLCSKIFTVKSKTEMVQNLELIIQNHSISIPETEEELLNELITYEYKVNTFGNFSYAAPSGEHDDMVCALMIACEYLEKGNGADIDIEALSAFIRP